MNSIQEIKDLIENGRIELALSRLDAMVNSNGDSELQLDTCYYLKGNAYRKQGNWQLALNNYQLAMDINGQSPAKHAYQSLMDVLNYYDKQRYNP